MTFVDPKRPHLTEVYLGSFDEDVLCGKVAVDGKRVGGEVGVDLCKPQGHMWLTNAVKGVTDGSVLPNAKRYMEDREGGEF